MLSLDSANRILAAAAETHAAIACDEKVVRVSPVRGGDINQAYQLETQARRLFLKLNQRHQLPLFESEQRGLEAIAATGAITTCRALASGTIAGDCYLILEFLDLTADGDWSLAGEQLARMHAADQGQRYGFEISSYCGSSLQPNLWSNCWAEFFSQQRLGHQLSMYYQGAARQVEVKRQMQSLRQILDGHQPQPSLLHGDLWRGNIGFQDGQPLIFDPAIYIGDRETDLAMTELFGRFPAEFYRAYNAVLPLDSGYPDRRELYQLYHLLNHANLFGGGYRQAVVEHLKRLCG